MQCGLEQVHVTSVFHNLLGSCVLERTHVAALMPKRWAVEQISGRCLATYTTLVPRVHRRQRRRRAAGSAPGEHDAPRPRGICAGAVRAQG